ncbi:MAG TPA: ATP-binding cassette domain-containing protein [Terriglobia bacterium]|nr:ATP-binding cassette domain-containing protein [Terriglobia bacterium]
MSHQKPASVMIEFRNVRYSADRQRDVLANLNLKVEVGETLVLVGRSGCGKTTTLKMINRLLDPSEGEILVEGRPVRDWDPIRLRRRIGYVIQEVGLFPHFTIERNIGLLPQLEGWPPERRRQRVDELLQMVSLDPAEFRGRYPRELSGGQRQRVGVARALAADPPILLMDEPFGALDPLTRAEIQRGFLALQKRLRKTIVFVTHDIREALVVGTRIALLEAGKLVGTYSRTAFLNSTDPAVAAYRDVLRTGDDTTES